LLEFVGTVGVGGTDGCSWMTFLALLGLIFLVCEKPKSLVAMASVPRYMCRCANRFIAVSEGDKICLGQDFL
jgi:hypothetical protein